MYTNLFMYVDIPDENINLLNGQAHDLSKECVDYERKIADAGGIDLFLCGVGHDGPRIQRTWFFSNQNETENMPRHNCC